MQASRMDDLHLKLENEGLVNISYMIVNHQGEYSQHKHNLLKQRVSEFIPVYKQDMEKPNVWNLLNGNKDDFLIYDRCGRLVYHLGLPYSVLHFPYMEEAIRIAFCETRCGNCSFTPEDINEICNRTENTDEPVEEPPPTSVPDPPQQNPQHHGAHRHHRQHGHQEQSHHHRHDQFSSGQNGQVHVEVQRPIAHDHHGNEQGQVDSLLIRQVRRP
ncbi:selenoprotein Pa [Latimeria chalumnae]|uniref:selenoprotein Pa n=1 Tax=Latimeria chalumnae TaxID=7897 RepID=UPI0006D91CA6|nr:PREDICTED: selenoprotein P [Latimeria chalumnae]|eukprot:XP_006014647.2 PREDICTED: selenoprotein P [Latimeria chalumnae]